MTKKTKKNRIQKHHKTRHTKRKTKRKAKQTRRKRGGIQMEDYQIIIPNEILRQLKILQEEGQQTKFKENRKNVIGNERGGHFCYTIDSAASQIVITGYNLAPIIPNCTSCNTGDYPFTFHTHPVVLINDGKKVDNSPNLISDEDLKGIIADSIWNVIGTSDDRQICDDDPSQATVYTSGVNIFDILAVPCGIYIYGLNPDKKPYPEEDDIDGEEEEKIDQLITPTSEVDNILSYAHCPKIKRYQKKLERLGFFLFYKSWADIAMREDMGIVIKFDAKSGYLSSIKCGNDQTCSNTV